MRIEFIGKKKATLEDVDVQSLKVGQTDIKPAVCLHVKVPLPNSCLAMFDANALAFLYQKEGPNGAKQKTLDGIQVVSEFSQLTDAAVALGALNWDGEQTGCTLHIHLGIDDRPKIVLRDGTTNKYKTVCHQGGTVDVYLRFYTTDVDAEVLGELGVLKNHDLDIELTVPDAISSKQKDLVTDNQDKAPAGTPLSPEAAFAKAAKTDKADSSTPVAKGTKAEKAVVH